MDENKLRKLYEVGYTVRECCGLCKHFQHGASQILFGTCAKHTYEHEKHSVGTRQLSVTRFGLCFDYEFVGGSMVYRLHKYMDLMEE